jgi:hypothetical protein
MESRDREYLERRETAGRQSADREELPGDVSRNSDSESLLILMAHKRRWPVRLLARELQTERSSFRTVDLLIPQDDGVRDLAVAHQAVRLSSRARPDRPFR